METLNYLACASAGLGRKRMESMKRRTSLAWLIFALLTGLLSLGIAGPEISRRREKRPWRSSRSQGSTIRYARRWLRRATASTRSSRNWQPGTPRIRDSRSAPASRLMGCRSR